MRVSKAATATRNTMYLNVWFDGNRDGDWADVTACQATESEPAQAGYEWIVQNYIIDMTAIPSGGVRDFLINTEKLFNANENLSHWMRFSLSKAPAIQPPFTGDDPGLPDGRGPHPADAPTGYQFGETEDIYQKGAPAGEDGTLELQKRVITTAEPTEWLDYVTYEIRLRHVGGSQPVQAQIRDELPYPLIVYPTINGGAIEYVNVASPTNGAAPLQATLIVRPPQGGNPTQQVVKWEGAIAPDAEVVLTFRVRVLALCAQNQQTMTFTNTAQARKQGDANPLTASDSFTAKCIDYDENRLDFEMKPITDALDLDSLTHVPARYTITNSHAFTISLGIFQQPGASAETVAAGGSPRFLGRVTLPPDAATPVAFALNLALDAGFTLTDDLLDEARLAYCVLPDANDICPDAQQFPQLHGQLPLIPLPLRTNDLGDAPDSSSMQSEAIAGKFGVAPAPAGDAGRGAATLGGWHIGVSRYSTQPAAAAAFAVYMTSVENQKHYAIDTSSPPASAVLYADPDIQAAMPFASPEVVAVTTARPSTATGAKYNEVSTLYFTAVHSILTGKEDAESAVELLELDLQTLLGQ